jgi:RIO-like serine/threonine protein kinase
MNSIGEALDLDLISHFSQKDAKIVKISRGGRNSFRSTTKERE